MAGEVVVQILTENPDRFAAGAVLLIEGGELRVASSRPHKKAMLVKFEGVETKEAADDLRGTQLFVPASEIGSPPEGWWESDLIGLSVCGPFGEVLGTLSGVSVQPLQDLWEVTTPSGVVLLPAVKEVVKSVDIEKKVIIVDPPAGLFGFG